jgi:hypothetical protein
MVKIQILEQDDTITANCWYRPLNLLSGYDDALPLTNTYGGGPINNVKWLLVGIHAPGHIGKKLKEINSPARSNCISDLKWYYEFILGTPPRQHIHFDMYEKYKRMSKGKYEGQFTKVVEYRDKKYYSWYNGTVRNYFFPKLATEQDFLDQQIELDIAYRQPLIEKIKS